MFRIQEVRAGLLHLIGWRQNDQGDFVIADSLLESESGSYFQQAHALMTLQNIKAIAPNFDNVVYPDYDELETVRVGDKRTYLSQTFRAIAESVGVTPDDHSQSWERFNPFSEWLENKIGDSIIKSLNRFIDEKVTQGTATKIVENKVLFDGAGRLNDIETTTSGAVGFEIIPGRSRSLSIRIEKIGLQFTQAGTVDIFIMHSSSAKSVYHLQLQKTKANSFEWFKNVNIDLPYIGDNDAGGSWYICYNINDLPEGCKPIYKSRDWSSVPCLTCDQAAAGFNLLSKYVEVYPVKAPPITVVDLGEDGVEADMWDIKDTLRTYESNYGINLELSVVCDLTDFILTQRRAFTNVILLQVATDLMKEMCYNPNARINRNAALAQRPELLYALDGDTSSFRRSGLNYQLDLAYKSIDVNLKGIDKVCLPCKNGGIKYRTV